MRAVRAGYKTASTTSTMIANNNKQPQQHKKSMVQSKRRRSSIYNKQKLEENSQLRKNRFHLRNTYFNLIGEAMPTRLLLLQLLEKLRRIDCRSTTHLALRAFCTHGRFLYSRDISYNTFLNVLFFIDYSFCTFLLQQLKLASTYLMELFFSEKKICIYKPIAKRHTQKRVQRRGINTTTDVNEVQ